jgi:CDP-6-deoxy-D-xylo-4-hexulose-3-dehydrase
VTHQYDYPTAFSAWGAEEDEAFARVRKSGRYTSGPEVEALEEEFARYHGMKYGVMVNSGSSANLVAVASLLYLQDNPLRLGDVAIVPAIAWSTTYAPLVQMGLDLLVWDVDETWNMGNPCPSPLDIRKLKAGNEKITVMQAPRLWVGCSVLGNPAYLPQIKSVVDVTKTYFLEDNCESLGATIDGKLTGTFGHLNTFSFFHSHQLSAIEGGMILTDSPEINRTCRLLRNHGNAGFLNPSPSFAQSYDFRLMGYNLRGLELHAAIARAQLQKLHVFKYERLRNLAYFEEVTRGLPIQCQQATKAEGVSRSPFGLSFTVESASVRERLVQALRLASVDCRLPTGGSFTKHLYGRRWRDQATPMADRVHETGLFLGNAPWPIDGLIDRAVAVMKATL